MAQTTENNEQPSHAAQELEEELSQQQFNEEVENGLQDLLGDGGETDEGEEGESDDEGYESAEDPHPQPPRRRQMEDERDQDFDPNEEVWMDPLYHVKLPKALAVLPLLML